MMYENYQNPTSPKPKIYSLPAHLIPNNACIHTYKQLYHVSESLWVGSNSLQPHELYSPWNSPGQNTGVGSLSFSRGFSQPRDQTQVSRITGGFFTSWTTREAPYDSYHVLNPKQQARNSKNRVTLRANTDKSNMMQRLRAC